MNKSIIRKKILKIRKINSYKNLKINFNYVFKLLKKRKINIKLIGGYYPYNHEIDSIEILKKFEKKKYSISLPKIKRNNKMNFYHWSLKDPLIINEFGIPEPIKKKNRISKYFVSPSCSF